VAVSLQRRPFTVDEFERMAEAGIFDEDERVELLAGETVAWIVDLVAAAGSPWLHRRRCSLGLTTPPCRRRSDWSACGS
jgi:hypothetical protein